MPGRGTGALVEYPLLRGGPDVEDLVADGHATAEALLRTPAAEHAMRQVLDREVTAGLLGELYPAPQGGIMGFVERLHQTSALKPICRMMPFHSAASAASSSCNCVADEPCTSSPNCRPSSITSAWARAGCTC